MQTNDVGTVPRANTLRNGSYTSSSFARQNNSSKQDLTVSLRTIAMRQRFFTSMTTETANESCQMQLRNSPEQLHRTHEVETISCDTWQVSTSGIKRRVIG